MVGTGPFVESISSSRCLFLLRLSMFEYSSCMADLDRLSTLSSFQQETIQRFEPLEIRLQGFLSMMKDLLAWYMDHMGSRIIWRLPQVARITDRLEYPCAAVRAFNDNRIFLSGDATTIAKLWAEGALWTCLGELSSNGYISGCPLWSLHPEHTKHIKNEAPWIWWSSSLAK